MQHDSKIIVSDTSCLILLVKINEIELLRKLATKIYITSIIKNEFGAELPNWLEVCDPIDKNLQSILEMDLDKGEASAIALMLEIEDGILLIDDLKGRKIAEKLNIRFSGTLGLMLKAKQLGLIKNIKPILDKVRTTNFRFSEDLLNDLLKLANEFSQKDKT